MPRGRRRGRSWDEIMRYAGETYTVNLEENVDADRDDEETKTTSLHDIQSELQDIYRIFGK